MVYLYTLNDKGPLITQVTSQDHRSMLSLYPRFVLHLRHVVHDTQPQTPDMGFDDSLNILFVSYIYPHKYIKIIQMIFTHISYIYPYSL